MAAIITEKFRTHNARQFREDFAETDGPSNMQENETLINSDFSFEM